MTKLNLEADDIARLRQAWAAGKASGIFGEIDFEALRAEGRERLRAEKARRGRRAQR